MKKFMQFIGGAFYFYLFLVVVSLIFTNQIIRNYGELYTDFWKTAAGILFVILITSFVTALILKLYVWIINKRK